MSKWGAVDTPWTPNETHELPIDFKDRATVKHIRDAAFGHVPFSECWCHPTPRFDGEDVIYLHQDRTLGGYVGEERIQ